MQVVRKLSDLRPHFDQYVYDSEDNRRTFPCIGTTLIFDFYNIMYRSVFATVAESPEDNETFYLTRHNVLASIFGTIIKLNPANVIFAIDSKNSWRYQVYPEYKQNRKERDTFVDIDLMLTVMNEFVDDMKTLFSNMMFVKVPKCEGDDIIGVLAHKIISAHTDVIIVSSDSDMNQLLALPNVRQYSPKNKEFVNCINPKAFLEAKIIAGDTSDNIKGIKPRVGPKTAEKIVCEGLMEWLNGLGLEEAEHNEILEKYKRNKTLIDFNCIPRGIAYSIEDCVYNYKFKAMDKEVIKAFFKKHKLVKHMEDWSQIGNKIKNLGTCWVK